MCTVTFINRLNTTFITSNRDENIAREKALPPEFQMINGQELIFPKDPTAGGSWFVVNEKVGIGIILNGAFNKHIPTGTYQKSRGLILLDIMSTENPLTCLLSLDLTRIEPFTLILFQHAKLWECRWDGTTLFQKHLDSREDYIWSSATLYNEESREQRNLWFREFLTKEHNITQDTISKFHQSQQNDSQNGFVIKRANGIQTLSITQAVIKPGNFDFYYNDLQKNLMHHKTLENTLF